MEIKQVHIELETLSTHILEIQYQVFLNYARRKRMLQCNGILLVKLVSNVLHAFHAPL
jgi:hypothetical protein